jgi:putative nucleotidyltransferase with HDIG domain
MTVATIRAIDSQAATPIWRAEELPPFPAIALKALNLIAGRDTSLLELCELIRSDPAFSTAILKIANSPLVSFSRNITSVLQASMLLGFRRLKSVVLTVGLKAYLQGPVEPLLRSCWRHSVACAVIAERTVTHSGFDKDFAYTAGIMHDLGRAAMVAGAPKLYARVVELEADGPCDLLSRERELFGADHTEAGASLVKLWNLPAAFLEVTSRHHDSPMEVAGMTSIVASSCMMADALGFGVMKYRSGRSYEEILCALPEAAQQCFPKDAGVLAGEIAQEIRVIETV